jgi:HK97 family phage major capsid protein
LLSGDSAKIREIAAKQKAVTDSTVDDSKAGLLIPSELLTEVLRIAEKQYGLARRDMMYLPFSGPGNSRTIPALGTSVTVKWTGEGAKKQSTAPEFSIVTQTLKKLAAIVPMTEEIIEDSAVDIVALLGQLFAEATSKEEDIQFFAGTGSPWTGILNNGLVNKVSQASGDVYQLTADDLLDMIDATPTGALTGAKFYFHRSILSIIRKIKSNDGQYIYQAPSAGLPGTIWNYPYETSDAFPEASSVATGDQYVLFGNLKMGAIFGDKQQLRVKMLDQATVTDDDGSTVINLAEQDMVALRIVERVGYVIALPKALTVLEAQPTQS